MRSILVLTALLVGLVGPVSAQGPGTRVLRLSFNADGRVNLSALNVTAREILAEWARQCGCYVVNADRLPGGPLLVPIDFNGAPQNQVLESLLRQAAGFVLTPRRAGSSSVSNYETIFILPMASSPAATTTAYVAPSYTPPPQSPFPTAGSPDDEIPPITPTAAPQGPHTPMQPFAPTAAGGVAPAAPAPPPSAPPAPTGGFVLTPIIPVNTTTQPPSAPMPPRTVPASGPPTVPTQPGGVTPTPAQNPQAGP
jgi:hypothetical protein